MTKSIESIYELSEEEMNERGLAAMQAFEVGRANGIVPMDHYEDGFPLYEWVDGLRRQHFTAPDSTMLFLRGLAGWSLSNVWYEEAAAVRAWLVFFKRYGHAGVITAVDGNRHLSPRVNRWINRSPRWREGCLDNELVTNLPDFGENVDVLERNALKRTLAMFVEREGEDAYLPADHVESNFPLGETAHRILGLCHYEPGVTRVIPEAAHLVPALHKAVVLNRP